jgi:hypothetical protein
MRPRVVVVGQILLEDARQPDFIHDDDVIEALAPNGANQTLGMRGLPR